MSWRLLLASRVAMETSGVRDEQHLWGVFQEVFLIVVLSPVISSALMTNMDFLFTLFPNVGKQGTWTDFEKDLIPLVTVQLPVLSHVSSRPSFCVSQQGHGVYACGKLGNLGKHLTPVLLLLPLSMASLSIWTCSVSTALFFCSATGHTFAFHRYLFGQMEKSHVFEQSLIPPPTLPSPWFDLYDTFKLCFKYSISVIYPLILLCCHRSYSVYIHFGHVK